MSDKAWTDLCRVMRSKIANAVAELDNLQRQVVAKSSEVMGLREGLDQIERFMPKETTGGAS